MNLIELTNEQMNDVVINAVFDDIKNFEEMLINNHIYHHSEGTKPSFAPLYSYDYDEEYKKLNKMLKSFIRVYNYRSGVKYEESL